MIKILILSIILAASSAINLRCSFNVYFDPVLARLIYNCRARVGPTWNSTHIIGFSGVHRDGFTDADVELISIKDGSELTTIPQGALQFFPNLIGFHLKRLRITRLNGNELNEYPNLKWFALESGPLEFVPGNFFQNNPLVTSVSFGGNRIREVGEGLFDGLENLHRVFFLGNVCINMAATTESEMVELRETLRSQCNGIKII